MKFNQSPSQSQLNELQNQLKQNPEPGIVDIWVCLSPFYLLAEEKGVPIGVASMSCGDKSCEIYKLYISPSHRRKGIGSALVNKAVEISRKNGATEVFIEIAGNSRPFWTKVTRNKKIHCYSGEKFGIKFD